MSVLDRGAAVSRGLVAAIAFDRSARDAVRGMTGTPNGSATLGARGAKLASSSSDYYSWANAAMPDDLFLASSGLSIMWRGTIDTTGARVCLISKCANITNNDPFYLCIESSAKVGLYRAHASNFYFGASTPTVDVGREHTVIVSLADNLIETTPRVWLDGVAVAMSWTSAGGSPGTGAVTGASAELRVGRLSTEQMDGATRFVYIWNRPLSSDEAVALTLDPYGCFMRPKRLTRFGRRASSSTFRPYVLIA